MNTYQILRRTVFGMIVAALLWSVAITASAEESYTVKIPKNIKLDSNGEYADTLITVNGTLASDQVLSITTNDTLTLSSQGKKDLSRKVKLSASIINSTDVSNGVAINCKITRKSIFFIKKDTPTAGTWNGNMEVSVQSIYTPSDFEWEIVNNRIRLKRYTGSNPNVVVHGNYYVKGKVYQTEVYQTFKNNSTVESIKFEKGIYCQYATDLFFNCSKLTTLDVSNFDTSNVTNMYSMFNGCTSLTTLDVSNFNTSKVTNMLSMFENCTSLTTLDLSNFNTSKVTNMSHMFENCTSLTTLDVSNFDTSKVTDMYFMFNNCSNLTTLDLSNFNTSKVTDMNFMFENCTSLTTLDLSNFNTSNVINMTFMFYGCKKLTTLDLSNFNTSKVTNMIGMFNGCTSLITLDVSNFDTLKVTDMHSMFNSCSNLTTLDLSNFNTSKVTDMNSMFDSCSNLTTLDVSNFDTSNVTNMGEMFYHCKKLTTLDLSNFDTSNVTNMYSMFYYCNSLTTLNVSNFDTSKVTNMAFMFFNCSKLTTLDLSNFNTSKVTDMSYMFKNCKSLTTLDLSNFDTSKVTDMSSMFYGDSGTVYVATADIKATMESKFTNMTFVVKNNKMSSASVLSAPTLSSIYVPTVSDGNADVAMDGPIINEKETIKDSVSSGDAETSTSNEIISDDTEDTLSDDDWMQLALSVSDGNAAPGDREKCEEKLTEMQESGITPEISELMKILMQIIISVILPKYRWY